MAASIFVKVGERGLSLRSRENRGALRVWARDHFSCVGQVGLRNFLLELLPLIIMVEIFLDIFLDYGSEHVKGV